MNKADTHEIVLRIKAAYPLFYSNAKKDAMDAAVDVWQDHIGKYSKDVVDRAIRDLIDHESQIPTIALVRSYIAKQVEADEKKALLERKWKEAGFPTKEAYEARIAELRR